MLDLSSDDDNNLATANDSFRPRVIVPLPEITLTRARIPRTDGNVLIVRLIG